MIGVGVVGYGYWGPNLVRNFADNASVNLCHVADRSAERIELVRRRYPYVNVSQDIEFMLGDPEVHAVAIATPTSSHYDFAMKALEAGKHVLVEKPMAATAIEAKRLIDKAKERGLTLMVDHTFIYTPAVRRIRELVATGALGDVLYYDSTRINLGLFQHDVDVLWDLAVHDLSILAYVLDEAPVAVSAVGKSHVPGTPENVAYLTLLFSGNVIAHINVNWLAPVKIRRTIIGGSRKMVVYDDLEPSEKIKIYDKGIQITNDQDAVRRMQVGYRIGDMLAPNLENAEALAVEVAHFIDCVHTRAQPQTSGEMGLYVVQALEAATRSMRLHGQAIDIATLEPKGLEP